jgi:hypothetical protein
LRQWDHFVVGAAAASEHREIVIGSAGMEPPSPLDCACCRSINEGRKRKSLSITFDIEKNSGIDCGDSADLTPLAAVAGELKFQGRAQRQGPLRVVTDKTQSEHNESALPLKAGV